jgi:hypothetical protein
MAHAINQVRIRNSLLTVSSLSEDQDSPLSPFFDPGLILYRLGRRVSNIESSFLRRILALAILLCFANAARAEVYEHRSREDFLPGWTGGGLLVEDTMEGPLSAPLEWGLPFQDSRSAARSEDRIEPVLPFFKSLSTREALFSGVGGWWRSFPSLSGGGGFFFGPLCPEGSLSGWSLAGQGPPGQTLCTASWNGDLFAIARDEYGTAPQLWRATPGPDPILFWQPIESKALEVNLQPHAILGEGQRLWIVARNPEGDWGLCLLQSLAGIEGIWLPIPRSRDFEALVGSGIARDWLFLCFKTPKGTFLVAARLSASPLEWHPIEYLPERLSPSRLAATPHSLYLLDRDRIDPTRTLQGRPGNQPVADGMFVHRFELPRRERILNIQWESDPPLSPGWRLSWRMEPEHRPSECLPWSFPSVLRCQEIEQSGQRVEYRLLWQGKGMAPGHSIKRVWIETAPLEKEPLLASAEGELLQGMAPGPKETPSDLPSPSHANGSSPAPPSSNQSEQPSSPQKNKSEPQTPAHSPEASGENPNSIEPQPQTSPAPAAKRPKDRRQDPGAGLPSTKGNDHPLDQEKNNPLLPLANEETDPSRHSDSSPQLSQQSPSPRPQEPDDNKNSTSEPRDEAKNSRPDSTNRKSAPQKQRPKSPSETGKQEESKENQEPGMAEAAPSESPSPSDDENGGEEMAQNIKISPLPLIPSTPEAHLRPQGEGRRKEGIPSSQEGACPPLEDASGMEDKPSGVHPEGAPRKAESASENESSQFNDSSYHFNQNDPGAASPSGSPGLWENPSPLEAPIEAENAQPTLTALSLNALPAQSVPAVSDFKAGASGNSSPVGTQGGALAGMAAARPPIAFKAILFSGKKATEPASTLLGSLPSPPGGVSQARRGTKDANTEKPYAPFLPRIFRGQGGAAWTRSVSLLLPLLLVTLSVLAFLLRAASSRRRRFSSYLDEALEKHKRRNRDRLIRENRRAAECNRPLRTLALPGVPSERGPVLDILVSEEPNPHTKRHASPLDPALPNPAPGRILMALPQSAPEQILIVIQKNALPVQPGAGHFRRPHQRPGRTDRVVAAAGGDARERSGVFAGLSSALVLSGSRRSAPGGNAGLPVRALYRWRARTLASRGASSLGAESSCLGIHRERVSAPGRQHPGGRGPVGLSDRHWTLGGDRDSGENLLPSRASLPCPMPDSEGPPVRLERPRDDVGRGGGKPLEHVD